MNESIVGKTFGKLIVLRPVGGNRYECMCEKCKNITYLTRRAGLLSRDSRGCRCLSVEATKERAKIKEDDYIDVLIEYVFHAKTLAEVGKKRGVTRERVRQIVAIFGEDEVAKIKKGVANFRKRDAIKEKDGRLVRERGEMIEKFWKNVLVKEDVRECWAWLGKVSHNGHGSASITFGGRKYVGAHKVAWLLSGGDSCGDKWFLHKCDDKLCCNPNHIYLGDAKDSSQRKERKGTGNRFALSDEEKMFISSQSPKNTKEAQELASRFGVTYVSILRHASGKYENKVLERRVRVSKKQLPDFVSDYYALSVKELQEKYKIKHKTHIYAMLKRAGVKSKKRLRKSGQNEAG